MNTLTLLLSLISMLAWGRLLLGKKELFYSMSLGFLIYSSLLTFLLFIFGWAGMNINEHTLFLLTSLLGIFALIINLVLGWRLKFEITKFDIDKLCSLEKLVLCMIAVLLFSSLVHGFYWPAVDWDSIALYDSRARFIYSTEELSSIVFRSYYLIYPLGTSLLHTVVYIIGFTTPLFLYTLYFACFLVCYYYISAESFGNKYALASSFLVAITYSLYAHAQIAYTNLPYSIFVSLGLITLFRSIKKIEVRQWLISAMLIGFSSWHRITEPFWVLAVIISLIIACYHRKIIIFLPYAALSVVARYVWVAYQSKYLNDLNSQESLITTYIEKIIGNLNFDSIWTVFVYTWNNAVAQSGWLIFAFLASMVIQYMNAKRVSLEITIQLLIIFGMYALLYAGSYFYYSEEAFETWLTYGDSLRRISMVFPPLLIYFTFVNLYEKQRYK